MGNSYTRQSAADIVAGLEIQAGPLNAEFNQLQSAFDGSAGHAHDGSTGEGPKIDLATSVTGVLPVARGGFAAIHNISAVVAPTTANDNTQGYGIGSHWVDTVAKIIYTCVDASTGAAVWNRSQSYNTNLNTIAGLSSVTNLSAIAGLTSAANKGITFTGSGTAATYDLSTFALTLLAGASQAAMRTTLGLTPGTDVQAYDSTLTALAAYNSNGLLTQTAADTFVGRTLTGPANGISVTNGNGVSGNPTIALSNDLAALEALSGTNTIYYRSAADTWSPVTIDSSLTFSAGTLAVVSTSLDPTLAAIAGLTPTTDQMIYFTGTDTAAVSSITSLARSLLADSSTGTMQSTLGLVIGTNVQAWDADLDALAALSGTNTIYYRSAANTWSSVSMSSNLSFSAGTLDIQAATASNVKAGTANKVPTTDVLNSAMAFFSVTDAATITLDHTNGTNQKVTLGGNRTFAAPTNLIEGLPFVLSIAQDATGSRVPSFNAAFDFGDFGTPTLSTGASNEDTLFFIARSTSKLVFSGIRKRTD